MAERASTTLRRKELGRRLRELRQARNLTLEGVAGELLCSTTKVSRMESGARAVNVRDVRDLCRLYQVDEAARDQLMELVRESHQTSWWQSYSPNYGTYIGLEQSASHISEYNAGVIPGLLQTADYAEAVIRAAAMPRIDVDEARNRARVRIERQAILTQDSPPQFWAIIDELALERVVGDFDVMAAQMEHLIERSRLNNVFLQVVPKSGPVYPGYPDSFILLSFAQSDVSPVLYLENTFGDAYLERPADIERSRNLFDQLRASGLGHPATRELLDATRSRFLSAVDQ